MPPRKIKTKKLKLSVENLETEFQKLKDTSLDNKDYNKFILKKENILLIKLI